LLGTGAVAGEMDASIWKETDVKQATPRDTNHVVIYA
jgi:hypothetical protein